MQDIAHLLKKIVSKQDDIGEIIDILLQVTGIQFERKDIQLTTHRDVKKVKIITTGPKKTKLTLCKGELSKILLEKGFMVGL